MTSSADGDAAKAVVRRLGVSPTGRSVRFEAVDAMRVRDGRITGHWGVANLLSLMTQLGALLPAAQAARHRR